jgi:hypothetical protein
MRSHAEALEIAADGNPACEHPVKAGDDLRDRGTFVGGNLDQER